MSRLIKYMILPSGGLLLVYTACVIVAKMLLSGSEIDITPFGLRAVLWLIGPVAWIFLFVALSILLARTRIQLWIKICAFFLPLIGVLAGLLGFLVVEKMCSESPIYHDQQTLRNPDDPGHVYIATEAICDGHDTKFYRAKVLWSLPFCRKLHIVDKSEYFDGIRESLSPGHNPFAIFTCLKGWIENVAMVDSTLPNIFPQNVDSPITFVSIAQRDSGLVALRECDKWMYTMEITKISSPGHYCLALKKRFGKLKFQIDDIIYGDRATIQLAISEYEGENDSRWDSVIVKKTDSIMVTTWRNTSGGEIAIDFALLPIASGLKVEDHGCEEVYEAGDGDEGTDMSAANCKWEFEKVEEAPVGYVWTHLDEQVAKESSQYDYWPGGGYLTFGQHILSLFPYEKISKMSGFKVFIEGPHTSTKLDLENKTAFGHYNPKYVRWIINNCIPKEDEKLSVSCTQPIYDAYLKNLARGFYISYVKLKRHPDCLKEFQRQYEESLQKGTLTSNYSDHSGFYDFLSDKYCDEDFRRFSGSLDENVYISIVPFWIRRSIDGTFDDFADGLKKLLVTFDKQFIDEVEQGLRTASSDINAN